MSTLKEAVAANTDERRALFQKGADRITAARVELAAALSEFDEAAVAENGADAELDAWVASQRNPAVPDPSPIAPDVAAPAPEVPPPVFVPVEGADDAGGAAAATE